MSESQPVPVYEMRVECMNYCYGGSPVLDLDEYPDPADPRAIVKYADHLAALAERDRQHAEALAEAEQRWEDWSNELADLLPPEYDGDDAQEAYILRFVRDHVAALTEAEHRGFARGYKTRDTDMPAVHASGYAAALDKAREAVAGHITDSRCCDGYAMNPEHALAAIDALAAGQAPPDPMLIASHASDCDLIANRPFARMRGHVCTCGAEVTP